MKRKGIGTLGQIGHKLSDNEKCCSHHMESDQMSAVYQRNNQVITRPCSETEISVPHSPIQISLTNSLGNGGTKTELGNENHSLHQGNKGADLSQTAIPNQK
jgi:hypothetical protein